MMGISWMRAVVSDGTTSSGLAKPTIRPPFRPVLSRTYRTQRFGGEMLRISHAAPVAKKDNLAAIPNGANGHIHQVGKRLAQLSVGEHCPMLIEFEIEEFNTATRSLYVLSAL
jgi:hypothetical protein